MEILTWLHLMWCALTIGREFYFRRADGGMVRKSGSNALNTWIVWPRCGVSANAGILREDKSRRSYLGLGAQGPKAQSLELS